jgi:hypothetical protein
MTAVMWMAAGCAACGAAVAMWAPASVRAEWICGLAGPFVAVAGSWLALDRALRRGADVSGVLLKAFAVKFVFFGLYVAVMVRGLALQPKPFIVSFACAFVTLYAVEAWLLQRRSNRPLGEAR